MASPFLYLVGDRLSHTELSAARIDGDLVEVGDAFIPADAVETPGLRAASLRTLVSPRLAVTRASAAWVHGALAEPPVRHWVQRATARRLRAVVDRRLRYSDTALPAAHLVSIAGLFVTTPERTLADAVRAHIAGDAEAAALVDALVDWAPGLASRTAEWIAGVPALRHRRPALRRLRELAQDDVTRYTS